MPRVPYNPVPLAQPTEAGVSPIHVPAVPAAFGAASARALSGLGQQMQQTSNELFTRAMALQQLDNENQAREISIQSAEELGKLRATYMATQGVDAKNALPTYQAGLQAVRQKALAQATNPMVKRMVDSNIAGRIVRDLDYAGSHAATEFKSYTIGTANAMADNLAVGAGSHWQNDAAFQQDLAGIEQQSHTVASAKGWSEPQRQAYVNDKIGSAWYNRIAGMATAGKAAEAEKLMKDHWEELGKYQLRAEQFVSGKYDAQVSTQITHGLLNREPYDLATQHWEGGAIGSVNPKSGAAGLYHFLQSTWDDVRKTHPELKLPATVNAATAEQQTAALHAFKADNAKYLVAHGVDASDANSHLAHFLGKGGAVKFIDAMKANPGQSAVSVMGENVARYNKPSFYHPDGTPRSLSDAYVKITAGFMGTGPFTLASTTKDLQATNDAAKAIVGALDPDNRHPQLLDRTLSKISTQWHLQHTEAMRIQHDTQLSIENVASAPGSQITSIDQMSTMPQYHDAISSLDATHYHAAKVYIDKVAKSRLQPTAAQVATYNNMYGALLDPGHHPEVYDPNWIANADLVKSQMNKLTKMKQSIMAREEAVKHYSKIKGNVWVKHAKDNLGITADDTKGQMQFDAAMGQKLEEWLAQPDHVGKTPDDATVKEWANEMQLRLPNNNYVWYDPFTWGRGPYEYQALGDFVNKAVPAYAAKWGVRPDAATLQKMFILHQAGQ